MNRYGKTRVIVCSDANELGRKAAGAVADAMRIVLSQKAEIRVVFAAGESQGTFLAALSKAPGLDWKRIICFNIDDFWDIRMPGKFTCGAQTTRELYRLVKPQTVNLVRFNAPDPEAECARFEALLRAQPLDIVCQGIGTSGHLALNEPGQCQFNDEMWVRLVELVPQSKKQLMADPNFKELGYIPEKGITMTIPAIFSAAQVYTMVPLALKKPILTQLAALTAPVELLPASILLEKEGTLFVDEDSCPDLWRGCQSEDRK